MKLGPFADQGRGVHRGFQKLFIWKYYILMVPCLTHISPFQQEESKHGATQYIAFCHYDKASRPFALTYIHKHTALFVDVAQQKRQRGALKERSSDWGPSLCNCPPPASPCPPLCDKHKCLTVPPLPQMNWGLFHKALINRVDATSIYPGKHLILLHDSYGTLPPTLAQSLRFPPRGGTLDEWGNN